MSEPSPDTCWVCRERAVLTSDAARPDGSSLLCAACNGDLCQPYEAAWRALSNHLHANWRDIVKRGSFDLSKVDVANASAVALQVHLHFVKLLGCKLAADRTDVDLSGFAAALQGARPHPEITLLIASCETERGKLLYYDTDVSVLRRDDEVYSAVWMNLSFPIAVKVCYLKSSAPVSEPEGFPWHPARQRKLVKLSPYKGDTRPNHARRDLRL